jgi:type III restriction enzyme
MDRELLGEDVHEINKLTVISNESYAKFTAALQEETQKVLRTRQTVVTNDLFKGKKVQIEGTEHEVTESDASYIRVYLEDNGYADSKGNLTKKYHNDKEAGRLAPLPSRIAKFKTLIELLLDSLSDPSALESLTTNGLETTIPEQKLNDRFSQKEFQELWKEINHKYVYRVSYDSNELIEKTVNSLNAGLKVNKLRYIKVEGIQNNDDVSRFGNEQSASEEIEGTEVTSLKYDLVGDIAKAGKVTRKTVVEILTKITPSKFALFQANPEEFIKAVAQHIQEQKATMVVEHIEYDVTNETFDSDIFTSSPVASMKRSMQVKKHITDYLVADSDGERRFAQDMDAADEVVVYAKLPRSFKIPTPVGNYAPDWAIAFDKNKVKHVFFIAETKGSMESTQLRQVEEAKTSCAKKLFDKLPTHNVRYGVINSFEELRNLLTAE